MAAILTNYDLSLGETRTSTVTAPSYADVQVLLGTVAGRVMFYAEKSQSTGDWIPMKDDRGEPIVFSTINEVENGINIQGMGGAKLSFRVVPVGTVTGTLSIDVITDGTIA